MSYTTKRKIMNSTVYIVLGLVITAVLCVSVATFVSMRKKKPVAGGDDNVQSTTRTNETDESTKDRQTTAAASETPSPASGTDQTQSEKETQVIDPVKPVNYIPADGCLLKEYSDDLPVFSLTMNDYRTHAGIDISAPIGSAVAAMCDGTVLDIYSDPMMGMCLSIDHGNGLVSIYKNLSAIFPEGIAKGVSVRAGQTVAAVGDTSLVELADAEHLHFELTENGKHIDPGSYLDLTKMPIVDQGDE